MKVTIALVLAVVLCACVAFVTAAPSALWSQLNRSPPETLVDLTIAIRQQNVDELVKTLEAVSNPMSPNYGNHLTLEEVNEIVAPTHYSVQKVKSWLKSEGVDFSTMRTSPNEDFLTVTVSVSELERMLETEYYEYKHAANPNLSLHRCIEYSLPDSVAPHIDIIGPTTRFPQSPKTSISSNFKPSFNFPGMAANPCEDGVTPSCLRQLYNIGNYNATSANSSAAVNAFLEQYFANSDLTAFFKTYDPASVGQMPNVVGPNDQTNPGTEASLDIQYIMSLGHGLNITFWYTAGRSPNNTQNEPFLAWLQALASDPAAPWVISTSYGDDYNTVDYDYAVRCNTEFAKAGARGISLLFSSGDSGVGDGSCTTFIPTFPATSPYVTSVGASQGYPEVVASFSSGGFSDYFAQPDYQKQAVSNYFNMYGSNFPPSSLYNASGRGFPDIACQGVDFVIVVGGFTYPVDGTSCSSPTCASLIALLNDVRFQLNKPSLGFLNYFLYQNVSMFNDVTVGNNPGCNTNGFYAAKQWDPVTGLGTPDFTRWRSIVTQL